MTDSKPILSKGPIPEVAVAVGATLMIFAAGLGLDAGWNAGALFGVGSLLGGLGVLGGTYRHNRVKQQEETA
jgi:hypothetical protein